MTLEAESGQLRARAEEPARKVIGFAGRDVPADGDLYKCVHCGLCLPHCPTYIETGMETESPRGRLALMRGVKEGQLGLTERLVGHMDLCLQCRACEAACPSGVPFGRLMAATRTQVSMHAPQSFLGRVAKGMVFERLLPHPGRLRLAARGLWVYEKSGWQWVTRATVLRLFPKLREAERQLPPIPSSFFPSLGDETFRPQGEATRRVGMLSGCVMPLLYGRANLATVRVLTRNGCEVTSPRAQRCCGALHAHNGELEGARVLARKNIDAFMAAGVEAVVVNSAGCGAMMKEYGDLLKDDTQDAERARKVSARVKDVTEFLVSLPFEKPQGKVEARVTYQDACHMAHAQGIRSAPREILGSIPGLELVEMEASDRCCGAAGIYSVTQGEMSRRLVEHKVESVKATGAEIVVTANPGCMMQLESGLRRAGSSVRVAHVVEILDQACQ